MATLYKSIIELLAKIMFSKTNLFFLMVKLVDLHFIADGHKVTKHVVSY